MANCISPVTTATTQLQPGQPGYPERLTALRWRRTLRVRGVLPLGAAVAIVSQLPDGTMPDRTTFVQRNPLIAALADVVFVVEADVRSGSLSTAAAAKKLGRIVAAWPNSRGCERLLAEGAALIESPADAE